MSVLKEQAVCKGVLRKFLHGFKAAGFALMAALTVSNVAPSATIVANADRCTVDRPT